MTREGTGAGIPGGRLSPHAGFDQALRDLLHEATPWLLERAAHLSPGPPLLLVLGSAASGEATGVPLREPGGVPAGETTGVPVGQGFLPLSDLDLGLFLERGLGLEQAGALRRELAERLRPAVDRHGLTHDPIDLGIYDLGFIRRMPPTLELYEAGRDPRVLGGDPAPLRALGAGQPRPFEALRLALNRLAEAFAGSVALPAGWRPEAPDAAAWQRAHRWAKLPADLLKALLAARGAPEPSLSRRLALARPTLVTAGLHPGAPERWGGADAAGCVEAWIRWRLAPQWPPPQLPLGGISDLARAVLDTVCARLGRAPLAVDQPGAWRAVLAAEDGPARERLRRWRRMLGQRPAGVGPAAALRLALQWGAGGVWPASLALLAFGLAWLEANGARDAALGTVGQVAPADAALGDAAGAGMETSLTRGRWMVHWARSAGA